MALRISLAIALAAAALIGGSLAAYGSARASLEAASCGGEGSGPPAASFYDGLRRVERLSTLPWLRGAASAQAAEAAEACQGAFEAACDAARDAAIERARGARDQRLEEGSGEPTAVRPWHEELDADVGATLCEPWSAWSTWLQGQGHDARAACPVCFL